MGAGAITVCGKTNPDNHSESCLLWLFVACVSVSAFAPFQLHLLFSNDNISGESKRAVETTPTVQWFSWWVGVYVLQSEVSLSPLTSIKLSANYFQVKPMNIVASITKIFSALKKH